MLYIVEWVSKEDGTLVVWNTTDKNDMIYHRVERQSPSPMVENGGIAEDATGYYATTKVQLLPSSFYSLFTSAHTALWAYLAN